MTEKETNKLPVIDTDDDIDDEFETYDFKKGNDQDPKKKEDFKARQAIIDRKIAKIQEILKNITSSK